VKRLAWVCAPLLGILCAGSAAQEKELTQEQIRALDGKPCNVDENRPGQVMVATEAAGKRTTKASARETGAEKTGTEKTGTEKTGTEKTGTEKTGKWRLQGSFTWKKTAAGLQGNIGFAAVCR
jgi:hypothetical protein